jgi:hypothetical protein
MARLLETEQSNAGTAARSAKALLTSFEALCHVNSAAFYGSGYHTRPFNALASMEAASVFHTVEALPLTLPDLLEMLVKCGLIYDESAALHAVVLMERYDARVRRVTFHMMHRLFVATLRIACKAHYDSSPSNAEFSDAVGVEPQELRRLEWHLAIALAWDLNVVGPAPSPNSAWSVVCSLSSAERSVPAAEYEPATLLEDLRSASLESLLSTTTATDYRPSASVSFDDRDHPRPNK